MRKVVLTRDIRIKGNGRTIPKDSVGTLLKELDKYWSKIDFNLGETFHVKVSVHKDWFQELVK